MKAVIERDVRRFLPQVKQFLIDRRLSNTLLISVLQYWLTNESPNMERIGVYVKNGDGTVVGAALNIQGWQVVLSSMTGDAARAIESALFAVDPNASDVTGPPQPAASFAASRSARQGISLPPWKHFGMFIADRGAVPEIEGSVRPADAGDLPLLTQWWSVFEKGRSWRATERARNLLLHGQVFLWEIDGTPVAVCGCTGALWGVAHLGHIYVVPEYRQAGYGFAVWRVVHNATLERGVDVPTNWINLGITPMKRLLTSAGGELLDEAHNYTLLADT